MTAGDKRDLSEGTECNLADQGDAKKSKTSHTAFLKEVLDRFFLAGKKEEEEKARKKEEEEKARKKEEEEKARKKEEEENNRLRLQAERRAEREAKLRADDDITDNPRQQQADSVVQYLGSGKVDLSALTSEDLAEIIAIRVMEVLRMFEEELGVLPEGWMAQHAQLRYNLIASLGKVYDANLATLEPFIEILQGPGRLYFFHSHKLMSALEHLLRMAPPKEKKDEKKEMKKEEKEEEDKGEVEKEDEKEEEDKGKCPAWLMLRMECSLASGGGGGGSGSSGGGGLGISKY